MHYSNIPLGFPGGSVVKNLPANPGDMGSIPGSGRSPGGRNGSLLLYSCLGNPMDRGAWKTKAHGIGASQVVLGLRNPPASIGDVKTWFHSQVRKIPWRRTWQPTPKVLPGESHGQRSLEGYSPQGCKELDKTEVT